MDRAREVQRSRLPRADGVFATAHLRPRELRAYCRLDQGADGLLKTAISRLGFTARAYHRVLKIARTIVDSAAAKRCRRGMSPRPSSTARLIGGARGGRRRPAEGG